MKNVFTAVGHLKQCAAAAVCCCWPVFMFAQPVLNPSNLSHPIAPGDRELVFNLQEVSTRSGQTEVWVFYAKNPTDLNAIDQNSFSTSLHFGRCVMFKNGSELECHFVFPHSFHAATPNSDLFCRSRLSGRTDLVTTGYPDCALLSGLNSGIIGLATDRVNTVKIDFNPLVIAKGECVYYRICKRIKTGGSFSGLEVSTLRKFRMPDTFNIGIAGDSYGAGEGAPNEEYDSGDDEDDLWISCPCHRSRKSGLLRGVKKFIDRNPEVAVDYSFTACSGAVTQNLAESEQVTTDNRVSLYDECGSATIPLQFRTIRNELIGDNHTHDEMQMLIMSIGGNNSGFGDVVVNYLLEPRNLATENLLPGLLDEYSERIDGLDADYSNVDQKINDIFSEVRPIIGITVYPDPTTGLSGRCGCNGIMNPGYTCALYENDCLHSTRSEYELLHDSFIIPLNNKVRETNQLFGWHVIDNINAGNHGLCNCEDPYFNLIGSSYDHQGDIYGLVHPNSKGYREMYRDKVYDFVESKYHEYREVYYAAVLFGLKSAPAACPDQLPFKGIALNAALRNLPVLRQISGLPIMLSRLNDKDIRAIAAENDEKKLAAHPLFKEDDAVIKSEFLNLPLSRSVVKQTRIPKTLTRPKPFGKNMLKVKTALTAYLSSPGFREKVNTYKKPDQRKNREDDPLDHLYNKNK